MCWDGPVLQDRIADTWCNKKNFANLTVVNDLNFFFQMTRRAEMMKMSSLGTPLSATLNRL